MANHIDLINVIENTMHALQHDAQELAQTEQQVQMKLTVPRADLIRQAHVLDIITNRCIEIDIKENPTDWTTEKLLRFNELKENSYKAWKDENS